MDYGQCCCGAPLVPIWFTDHERDERGILTGRTRRACSYLLCEECGERYAVDESFDGAWKDAR